MPTLPSYCSKIWRITIQDCKTFWTPHKIAVKAAGPLIGVAVGTITGVAKMIPFSQIVVLAILSGTAGLIIEFMLTMLVSLAGAPKILYDEQSATITGRDTEINKCREENGELRNKLAESLNPKVSVARQAAFDFHLEVDTKETIRRTMPTPQPGNPIDVDLPVVYLVVINKGPIFISIVRYRLNDAQWIKVERAVPPNVPPYKLDITEQTVEYLTKSIYPQSPGPVHSKFSILIECLGDGDPMPPIGRLKRFGADVERTRAHKSMAGLKINIQPE
jgi:hypothetical protein